LTAVAGDVPRIALRRASAAENGDFVTASGKTVDNVDADEAGAADDEQAHVLTYLPRI